MGCERAGRDPFDKGILCSLGLSKKQTEILRPFGTQDDNRERFRIAKKCFSTAVMLSVSEASRPELHENLLERDP